MRESIPSYEYRLVFILDQVKGANYCFPCDEHGMVKVKELDDRQKAEVHAARIRAKNGCRVTIDRIEIRDGEIYDYWPEFRVVSHGPHVVPVQLASKGNWIA